VSNSEALFKISLQAVFFYGKDLLALRPTRKLEDHLLLAVRNCLFNILVATFQIWRPSPPSATRGRAMDPNNVDRQ